jgi:hypothetical protein
MPAVLTDDLLAEFVVEGTWAEVGAKLLARYTGLADRLSIYNPYTPSANDSDWKRLADIVKGQ